MNSENLTDLNDQELLLKAKKVKTHKIIDAFIIGILIGVVIYSTVKNGFGFSTILPLVLAYFIFNNSKKNNTLGNEIREELKSRNLS